MGEILNFAWSYILNEKRFFDEILSMNFELVYDRTKKNV